MNATDIIGYAYEAEVHCVSCTFAAFDVTYDSQLDLVEDSEGNAIHPIFANMSDPFDRCAVCQEFLLDS